MQLAKWRKQNPGKAGVGPKSLLLLAGQAGLAEMQAMVELLTAEERERRPVADEWMVKDVLGHLADWEGYYASILAAGRAEPFGDTIENWNAERAAIRREQSWQEVWRDYQAARQSLLAAIEQEEDLGRRFINHWGREVVVYNFAMVLLDHEREHVRQIRPLLPGLALPKNLF